MSRIGKKPVPVPAGTTLTIAADGATVTVKGAKGTLTRTLPMVKVALKDGVATVLAQGETPTHNACHGLSRMLLANMVKGVHEGHKKNLVVSGTGYKVELAGQRLTFTIGYSHPCIYDVPKGIGVAIEEKGTVVALTGPDKEVLGQVAANIRAFKKPEPYKGKGIRYSDEVVRRKAGKTGK